MQSCFWTKICFLAEKTDLFWCFWSLLLSLKKKKKKKSHFAFKEEAIHQSTKRHKSIMSSSATAYTLGVRTRAQKRRMGERDLWDLIVNNDDICFKHILPRLNSNDVKFLYEVNTETRKLIKRSSRASDLKKKFEVEEMSSISTLEVAWENKSLWPSFWGKKRNMVLPSSCSNE